MQIDTLRHFIVLAQCESFSKASERLYLSQQGLSKSVTSLEHETGFKLLDRDYRGIRLTENGRIFLEHATSIVADYDAMIDEMIERRQQRQREGQLITLATTSYVMQTLFASMSRRTHFFNHVRVQEATLEDIFEEMEKERAGAAENAESAEDEKLRLVDLPSDIVPLNSLGGTYDFEPLFRTKLGILCHDDFPLGQTELLSVAALSELPLALTYDEALNAIIERQLAGSVRDNCVLRTRSSALIDEWLRARRVVALFDSYAAFMVLNLSGDHSAEYRFVPLDLDFSVNVGFIHRSGCPLSPACQRFKDSFVEIFREENAGY